MQVQNAGEFATIQELAEAVGLAERHVSRQQRVVYLALEVLKRLICGPEASAVNLYDLCSLRQIDVTGPNQTSKTVRRIALSRH